MRSLVRRWYISIYIEREGYAVIISQGERLPIKTKKKNRKWSDSFFFFFFFFSLVDKSMTVEPKKLLAILFFFYAAVYLSVYLYIFSLSHSWEAKGENVFDVIDPLSLYLWAAIKHGRCILANTLLLLPLPPPPFFVCACVFLFVFAFFHTRNFLILVSFSHTFWIFVHLHQSFTKNVGYHLDIIYYLKFEICLSLVCF